MTQAAELRFSRARLSRQYWEEGRSLAEVGALYGVTKKVMRHQFILRGIPRRREGSTRKALVVTVLRERLACPSGCRCILCRLRSPYLAESEEALLILAARLRGETDVAGRLAVL